MKIAFCMIVFNGDFFLEEIINRVKEFGEVYIVEGCVQYWQDKGYQGSNDGTVEILERTGVTFKRGLFKEKDEQMQALNELIPEDTDYIWYLSADEIYLREDMIKTIKFLEEHNPRTVSFLGYTFFGGFDYYVTGTERNVEHLRIMKYGKFISHRPVNIEGITGKDYNGQEILDIIGTNLYHYSYVSPFQVHQKSQYYQEHLLKEVMIENWFENVWWAWVKGDRDLVEHKYDGVQEFKSRKQARTELFLAEHAVNTRKHKAKFMKQLKVLYENMDHKLSS